AALCYLKFIIGIEVHRLLVKIALAIFKPADQPPIDSLSAFERSAVRARTHEEAHLVFSAVESKPASRFVVNKLCPVGREIIIFGCLNSPWRWGRQFHKIPRL